MKRQSIRMLSRIVVVVCVAMPGEMLLAQAAGNNNAGAPANEAQAADHEGMASEMKQLRAMIEELRQENQTSRAEMRQLREELEKTQSMLEKVTAGHTEEVPPSPATAAQASPQLEARVEKLEESSTLLNEKVDEQYQTKVEAASKYRARLSGIVLMNAFRNHGTSDNFDYPDFAQAASGLPQSSFGATLRQSEIGLEIFGPNLAGAKTSANVHLDFAGGFPAAPNGVDFGIVRLKTASLRFDWEHTSVVAGQDSLFISPLSPTSFASLATPAFAYAGNLWGWIPQLRVEHRFDLAAAQTFTVQAGILDNVTWNMPPDPYYRYAGPGEQSGQPAYAARAAWSRPVGGREISFGAAGYYGRQDWSEERYLDGWAAMGDWEIPLTQSWMLSGEFYRGRGAGGLGAGIGQTVVYGQSSEYSAAPIRGVDSAGGWSQLKWQITPKLEMNGVFAEDDAFSRDVLGFATDQNNSSPILGRNRGALGNVVFRPRSDLILAAEFRRLRTYPFYSNSSVTNQVNLAMGVLF
ncbi:conserved exported hypothetical protein [Candidatus Sulfotelmatobacter kueseliae]|uniref:Porin n=1 Tax=Candidatus Sulfotelmatobacter kueseliae TaxID=2042962 RepID=A0A2U3KYN8_9BACT|nr:conserved exported hypothetical protein [Candidatus Sulfotelmatobacter kueseliae]